MMTDDTLLSPSLVTSHNTYTAPVIVVGMPRSGSSFLSHVLSQLPGWYVFDDLYLQDKAKEIGLEGPMGPRDLDKLLFFLGWQIRARLRFGKYAVPNISEQEVELMNDALRDSFANREVTWPALQKEWMVRLAQRSNCTNWGYKLPKAFYTLDKIFAAYPEAKVVYLLRQPHDVLRSFKFIEPDNQDGHPDRYHPLFYALYWRLAARSFHKHKVKKPERVMLVKFSDLTNDTQGTATRLADLLNVPVIGNIAKPDKPNSSFTSTNTREDITGLEYFIINLLCGKEIARLGFERRCAKIKISDFGDILYRSFRFLRFRLMNRRKYLK